MAIKANYHIKSNTKYEEVYFKTSADQIITDENHLFVSQEEKDRWNKMAEGGGSSSTPAPEPIVYEPPGPITGLRIVAGNKQNTIYWSDPADTIKNGQTVSTWKGTKLVQKVGSYPTSPTDGTVIVDNQVRDKYKSSGYVSSNLTNQTYYYALFPYSDQGLTNTTIPTSNKVSGTPTNYRKMSVVINLANSNPSSCISYADDAVNMTAGSSDWDDFFGHYPCLLLNGKEQGVLNKNNFAVFNTGATADITSGSGGDVMIAYPRLAYSISRNGNQVIVSMMDDPAYQSQSYAHNVNGTIVDKFYLGVYQGYVASNKLRSLKGKTPTGATTITNFRTYAKNNGTSYQQMGFYQLIFLQCMFILKYKNLNSQSALGQGYVGGSGKLATGGTETWGMDYGYPNSSTQHVKCFGIEDLWGNMFNWIDGLFIDSSRNALTGNYNFNNTGSGYTNNGYLSSNISGGYMYMPWGTSTTGFLPTGTGGSSTTYFCDYVVLTASRFGYFGGAYNSSTQAGMFCLAIDASTSNTNTALGGRLMYLAGS
jgi:hypothetical protein